MAIDTAEAGDLVDEAVTHAADCRRAHDAGDHAAFGVAHQRLLITLRAARVCLRGVDYGGTGASPGSIAVQTSAGAKPGAGTSGGRGSPLMVGDFTGWLDRARDGARRR